MVAHSNKPLTGQVAVVAGATGGIGNAIAARLALAGATIVVGFNSNSSRANLLIRELDGRDHIALQLPLTDSNMLRDAIARIGDKFSRLDILVNAAGVSTPIAHSSLEELTDEIFDDTMAANVRGPFALIRAAFPLLKKSDRAVVVNISSISGFLVIGGNIAYCASKAALDAMSKALARALAPEIRVITISPGAVPTNFVPGRNRAWFEKSAESVPLKRVVEVSDVADAVLAAVTSLRACTGIVIPVDGGRHLI